MNVYRLCSGKDILGFDSAGTCRNSLGSHATRAYDVATLLLSVIALESSCVRLTLRVKLCGRGPRAEADAARRLPHVSRRAASGVPP